MNHEEWCVTGAMCWGSSQAPEHLGQLSHPSCFKLLKALEDARLLSLQDHTIRPLDLPVGPRVTDCSPVYPNVVVITKTEEPYW
jgi:hypothetical protein